MEKENTDKKTNNTLEELGYTPSKTITEAKLTEEEIALVNLEGSEEYEQYLKLKAKYEPLEKKKKEKPLLKILKRVFIGILVSVIILFSIGYIMGKNGYKPQQLDWEVVTNQINNDNNNDSDFSELEKTETDNNDTE